MPALPPVPHVIRFKFHGTLQDDLDVIMNFHIGYTGGPPNLGDMNLLASSGSAAWAAHIAPAVIPNFVQQDVTTIDLSGPATPEGFIAAALPGTRAGNTLSASPCAVINKQIARRYRGGKPKTFLWAGAETDLQTTGTWKAAFTAFVQAAWEAFIAEILGTAGLSIPLTSEVNVSMFQGFNSFQNPVTLRWRNVPKVRAVPVVDPIEGVQVMERIGSQRRRNF